jgi:hypothetical protein
METPLEEDEAEQAARSGVRPEVWRILPRRYRDVTEIGSA